MAEEERSRVEGGLVFFWIGGKIHFSDIDCKYGSIGEIQENVQHK